MQQNKILDIIINLLSGIKNENSIVEELENETKMTLNGCSYLLNQTLRQYAIQKSHYFISERTFELWNKISTDDILKYTYRDKVTKNTNDYVQVDKYKGGEKDPYQKQVTLKKGDSFIYNDVFTDEHIVTVSDIIKELLKLPKYTYSSIIHILDKMYICKMLKSEDRMIKNKSKRSTDYKEVIVNDYLSVGIKLKDFQNTEQLLDKKKEKGPESSTTKIPSPQPIVLKQQRKKVKHVRFGEGEIISINANTIKVVFGLTIQEFPYPNSINDGTLKYINNSVVPSQKFIIHKKRNTFFCFQGLQYDNELKGGYIFALSDGVHHHERLRLVKENDIIFHCADKGILAVSVAEDKYFLAKRPEAHLLANDKKDEVGLMVKTKYLEFKKPIITSQYKNEIKKMQGDHEGMGYSFDKNGEGNQGYLFNLNKSLANFFLNEIIKCNSDLLNNQNIQALLQENKEEPKKAMKLCPICGLNWIKDDENCCSVCDKQNSSIGKKVAGGGEKKQAACFPEEFTFTNENASYRGKVGFQAYNSKGENVGLVFMTDDSRTPAYENCELCMYPAYYNQYGEWHRITSHGGRIEWSKLCDILKQKTKHKVFID